MPAGRDHPQEQRDSSRNSAGCQGGRVPERTPFAPWTGRQRRGNSIADVARECCAIGYKHNFLVKTDALDAQSLGSVGGGGSYPGAPVPGLPRPETLQKRHCLYQCQDTRLWVCIGAMTFRPAETGAAPKPEIPAARARPAIAGPPPRLRWCGSLGNAPLHPPLLRWRWGCSRRPEPSPGPSPSAWCGSPGSR